MIGLAKINSMTKYPSILTYHTLGEKGKLQDIVNVPFDGPAILTEKIDGTNGRIILFPNGLYIIGSRDELLYAKGDLIGNHQLGIVDVLKPIAEQMTGNGVLITYYFEVYGGNTTKNGKQYTGNGAMGARLFDVAAFPDCDEILALPIEKIASWRDHGGQTFLGEETLEAASDELRVSLTPRISISAIPAGLSETFSWLRSQIQKTGAALDEGAMGRPEGIVARTADRSKIAKLRFEDYERTFRVK